MTLAQPVVRKGYLDAPTGQVHYRVCGEGVPLLLLHQCPSSGRQYEAAFPYLAAAGVRCIAIDTPGYGMSDPPAGDASIELYAANVPAVLDFFGIKQAAVLGHHTGASIACETAARYPERVAKVILNGTPIYREPEREAILARWRQEEFPIAEDGSHLLEPWNRRMAVSIGWTDLRVMTRCVVEMLSVREREWIGFVAAFNYQFRPRLESITVPGMVLTNTGEDLYQLSQRARRYRPDFTYVELPGGTHDIVDEQPEAWSEVVARFVTA